MYDDDFVPITPVNFFQLAIDCRQLALKGVFPRLNMRNMKPYMLPDITSLCSEESFADVALGWDEEGLEFCIAVNAPFGNASYPNIANGDSVELFIDTRDVKTAGFNTRFCHHFFFLPEAVDGHIAGEITRFRTEDVHPLCDPSALKVKSKVSGNEGYTLNIFIPKECLYGYDPAQFQRLGFSYRINRTSGFPQHFSVTSDDYSIDQQPALWSSLRLVT